MGAGCVSVTESGQSLAVELGEVDAVGLVSDEQIEDRPDQGQAAVLAGEPAHHLGPSFDFAEGALEQVRRPPPSAVSGRVAQVHDERVEIVGQAAGGGAEPFGVELVDERLRCLRSRSLIASSSACQ